MENGSRHKNFSIRKNCFRQAICASEYTAAAVKTGTLMLLIGWLFYDSVWAILVCLPLGIGYFLKWEKECVEKKKQAFRMEFQEALHAIAASLHVGYSLENAMKEAKKDLDSLYEKETLIQKEFDYMLRQLYLQIPVEQVLEEWAERMDLEEVRSFGNIVSLAKRSGGNMVAIIQNSIHKIRDRMEVQQEIETILAAKKYEFKVMSVIPLGIIAYMRVSFPEFMDMLYGNVLGIGVMSGCLGVYIAAYFLGEQIVNIEI